MIDGDGYAYYAERQYCCPRDEKKLIWFWDNNQYDFLIEYTIKAIEILKLRDHSQNVHKFFGFLPAATVGAVRSTYCN